MVWRDKYKVHPAADVFPMMSDDELAKLGEDILANGLRQAILFFDEPPIDCDHAVSSFLLDGRNRLEAMERVGLQPDPYHDFQHLAFGDPVKHVISLNINRRHLTKREQADLIVAAIKAGEKPVQAEPVSRGGRGKVNGVKAKAVAEAKKLDISEATVKRSIAKAEGKTPKPRTVEEVIAADKKRRAAREAAKEARLEQKRLRKEAEDQETDAKVAELMGLLTGLSPEDIERIFALIRDSDVQWRWHNGFTYEGQQYGGEEAEEDEPDENGASTLPEDGRSEVPVDDHLGDIPECLDRRRN